VPPKRRVVLPSACVKLSKIAACRSGAMPIPVSRTLRRTVICAALSARRSAWIVTSPAVVNLIALPTRLTSICRSRAGSPRNASGTSAPTSAASSSPFSCARGPSRSATSSITPQRLKSITSSVIFPASIFEKSRMSLMTVNSASALWWTVIA